MIFDAGPTFDQRFLLRRALKYQREWDRRSAWRPWFAWYPVRIHGTYAIWWEWVERRDIAVVYWLDPTRGPRWEYRLPEDRP